MLKFSKKFVRDALIVETLGVTRMYSALVYFYMKQRIKLSTIYQQLTGAHVDIQIIER